MIVVGDQCPIVGFFPIDFIGVEGGGRFRSARVAIEANDFRWAIEDLMPQRNELDDMAAIQLALLALN